MKAVILAAGLGRRMASVGWDRPKCLLPCPGGTLLDNLIVSTKAAGIDEFILVLGYKRDLVVQSADRHDGHFTFLVNEEFADTNTLFSLWLAREHLREAFVLINGDVWIHPRVFAAMLSQSAAAPAVSLLAVVHQPCGAEEVKVVTDQGGRVTAIGKGLPPDDSSGEFVGVACVASNAAYALVESLSVLAASPGGKSLYFEAAVGELLGREAFHAWPIAPDQAFEIDTPEDLARAGLVWRARPASGPT